MHYIWVCGNSAITQNSELFSALSSLFSVQFYAPGTEDKPPAGFLAIGPIASSLESGRVEMVPGRNSLTLPDLPSQGGGKSPVEVKFANTPLVPWPFRGRKIVTSVDSAASRLQRRADERVLASIGEHPVWTVSETGGAKHFMSSFAVPSTLSNFSISQVFCGARFLELLPLIHFLRLTIQNSERVLPRLRASYIIDDPNLHWPRYGYVDYREMAARAERGNYHIAFATIPFDAWLTHATTARIFHDNRRRFSLLIHGNNHSRNELARNYSPSARSELLRQALHRIERLERKTKLRVSRVMVPPHGACSEEMLGDLPRHGFEGACISAGSLCAHNARSPWIKYVGYSPSETIAGCPVLPRSGFTGSVENGLLIAAYLGQPLILRGHHADFKQGLDILDEFSSFINGLGDVAWSNMTDIFRMSYAWNRDGDSIRVKPYANKVNVIMPSGTTALLVEDTSRAGNHVWRITCSAGRELNVYPNQQIPLSHSMGQNLLLHRIPIPEDGAATGKMRRTSVMLIARRLATEARDRFRIA